MRRSLRVRGEQWRPAAAWVLRQWQHRRELVTLHGWTLCSRQQAAAWSEIIRLVAQQDGRVPPRDHRRSERPPHILNGLPVVRRQRRVLHVHNHAYEAGNVSQCRQWQAPAADATQRSITHAPRRPSPTAQLPHPQRRTAPPHNHATSPSMPPTVETALDRTDGAALAVPRRRDSATQRRASKF